LVERGISDRAAETPFSGRTVFEEVVKTK